MKKSLPISLIVLCNFFAGISGNTAYQSQSFPYKIYCINNNAQKQPVYTFENLMADKLINEECSDMIISLSNPEDQYKEAHKISDEIPAKQTRDIDANICNDSYKFFNNLITFEYKKGYDIIANQVGRAGIILDRLNFEFTKFSGRKLAKYHTISVSQKTEG